MNLPEITEEIYELFGGTDLIEPTTEEPGYRWTEVAEEFANFLTDDELSGSIFD